MGINFAYNVSDLIEETIISIIQYQKYSNDIIN